MMKKERNITLDIIRTVSISLVLMTHVFISIGYPGETLRGMEDIFPLSLWIISHACIPMFLMLSGYLCKNKTLSPQYYLGLIKIVGVYVLCSLVCVAFRGLYMGEEIGLRYIVGSVINFYACDYAWYACMYIGLFLLIPFLNLIYEGLGSRNKRLVLIATMFALSSLPSILNQFVQLYSIWWERLFPILFYFIGAYLSDYRPKISAAKGFIVTVVLVLSFSAFDVLMYKDNGRAVLAITSEHYQIFFTGVMAFIAMLGIKAEAMPKFVSGAVVKISELSYAMYLLSWVSDSVIYKALANGVSDVYTRCAFILPAAVLSFIASLAMAAVIMVIFRPIEKLIFKAINAATVRFDRREKLL